MKQLGDILLEGGLRHPRASSTAAFEEHAARSAGPSAACSSTRACSPSRQLVAALATQIGLRVRRPRRLRRSTARRSAACPARVCRRHTAMPDRLRGRPSCSSPWPTRPTSSPSTTSASLTGCEVTPVVATARRRRSRRSTASTAPTPTSTTSRSAVDDEPTTTTTSPTSGRSSRTRRSSSSSTCSITQAIQDRASDIHVEPTEHDLRVRYRIDGVLHEVHALAASRSRPASSAALKIMADINIAERRIPQDGRISVNADGRKIDLRVATLPTVWGEKVVMRILDNSTARLDLRRPRLLAEATTSRYSRASPSRTG